MKLNPRESAFANKRLEAWQKRNPDASRRERIKAKVRIGKKAESRFSGIYAGNRLPSRTGIHAGKKLPKHLGNYAGKSLRGPR